MNKSLRADDSGVGFRLHHSDLFRQMPQISAGSETEIRELALDALFGQEPSTQPSTQPPAGPTSTPAAEAKIEERDFEDHLGRLELKITSPANDDRADTPDGRTHSPARSRAKLRRIAQILIAASLVLLASGLAAQLDLGATSRIGRVLLWPVVGVNLLLLLAYLSGLADLTLEANRRRDGQRRDDTERVERRAEAVDSVVEFLRTQAFDVAADVAQLRIELAVLTAMPRLEPAHFALFTTKIDAQFARLTTRISEQKIASELATRREEGLLNATARLDQRTQDIARDIAEMRIDLGDVAAAPKLESSHFAIFYNGIETKLGDLAARLLAEHEASVVETIRGLRADTPGLLVPTDTNSAEEGSADSFQPEPIRVPSRVARQETFCDGLAVFLDDSASLSEGQRSLLEGASLTLDMMFDFDALMLAWDAYRNKGRADFRSIYRPDFGFLLPAVRRRLEDETFEASAVAYCEDYETVLTVAGQSASDAAFLRALCSRRGRCYTLLAHAIGRIASVEGRDGPTAASDEAI